MNPCKKSIPLGESIIHSKNYHPDHLFPVGRARTRENIGIFQELPFSGFDIWNAYEISWLDKRGKPQAAMGEILFPCTSKNIVESKSLKLYLNSFNQSRFESPERVAVLMEKDLSRCTEGPVRVDILLPDMFLRMMKIENPSGESLDKLDIEVTQYQVDPSLLFTGQRRVSERLFSNLLRTNCPVTGQPDWGTVMIDYTGRRIAREGLLAYIISFREHTGFHENCVERMFMDIMERCSPEKLSVYARFNRRGGIDINPFRTNCGEVFSNVRLARQ
ncbi:MAG: NADPH-dependent 7-cyano-7-deazaguanine reductase QueF [Desulfamplus sp.]|nr:NADPH-dependent 7-cyano-7-deazaguanine reductase QueF [Desulfamplus sp.]